MDTNPIIRQVVAQHQHWMYREASKGVAASDRDYRAMANSIASVVRSVLPELSNAERYALLRGQYTTGALREIRDDISGSVTGYVESLKASVEAQGKALAEYESSFAVRLLSQIATDISNPSIDPTGVYKEALRKPVMGMLYNDMLQDVDTSTKRMAFQSIRNGISTGATNDEIAKALCGTKKNKNIDGLLNRTRSQAEMIVRTTRNQVANEAYQQTYSALGVSKVALCATLDGRTSKYCAAHDGDIYDIDSDFPRPPYHPHCRTVLIPVEDGIPFKRRRGNTSFKSIGKMNKEERQNIDYSDVDGMSYEEWFSHQDSDFQKTWLGPVRYKLYKDGGFSLKKFADPVGGEYTIEELRERDEQTFNSLFGKA